MRNFNVLNLSDFTPALTIEERQFGNTKSSDIDNLLEWREHTSLLNDALFNERLHICNFTREQFNSLIDRRYYEDGSYDGVKYCEGKQFSNR